MNNEQAIDRLRKISEKPPIRTNGDDLVAITMAIKAISQEPCERFEWGIDGNVYKITKAKDGKEICQQVCDDAISRDAVLDIICRETEWYDIRTQIEQLPSVTQKSSEDMPCVSPKESEEV